MSLASVLPSILNLECHLQQHPTDKPLTASMLADLQGRFEPLMKPDCKHPLPAAACFVDPTVYPILAAPELTPLCLSAKAYVMNFAGEQSVETQTVETVRDGLDPGVSAPQPVGLRRFAFLAAKMAAANASTSTANSEVSQDSARGELNRY